MKNIRGAREFLIGYGKNHPSQLNTAERDMLHRWYEVTPADYDHISSSISTTKMRESKVGGYQKRQAKKSRSKSPTTRTLKKSKRPTTRTSGTVKLSAEKLKQRACSSKHIPAFLKRYC